MASSSPHDGRGRKDRLTARLAAAGEGALEAVPFLLVAGTVAFGPFGSALAGVGVAGAFLAAILATIAVIRLADRKGIIAGPSLGLALILAGTLATLHERHMLDPATPGAAIAVAMALTVACGLAVAGVARLGMGRLAALVPYPVLVGLRNGTAILLIVEQLEPATGLAHGAHGHLLPGAMIVTAATIAAMRIGRHRLPAVPAIARGLAVGLLAHHLLAAFAAPGLEVGPGVEAALPRLSDLVAGWRGLAGPPGAGALPVLLPALASMVLLCVFETVATASALQGATGQRGSGRGDMMAVAVANIAGGLFGALPVAGSLEESVPAADHAIGRARATVLLRAGLLVVLAALTLPNLHRIPAAVLAGVIIVAALEVGDAASLRAILAMWRTPGRRRFEDIGNLLIVLIVAAVAVIANLATAVLVGSHPDDPLAHFHLRRLLDGAIGARIDLGQA
jgi:MFS superfamily sulfate permease-like transporter